MTNQEKVDLYFKYVKAYEDGKPLVSDAEFDIFEEEIKKIDKDAVKKVAAGIKGTKNHWSPMLSLDKVHAYDIELPIEEIKDWFNKKLKSKNFKIEVEDFVKECTPKFDGNAINLKYKDGKLIEALSRTDKLTGNDHYNKLKFIVPTEIDLDGEVEIRGEIVIKTNLFERKYKKTEDNPEGSANERNYVTGILKGNGFRMEQLKELDFVAYDVRQDGVHCNIRNLESWGFPILFKKYFNKFKDFETIFNAFLEYREKECPYRLDGFVIKVPVEMRSQMGENDHDPNWALAIKFPPADQMTVIEDITNNVGLSGELTPVAILTPMELDGTTVTKATLHNWGYVKENKIRPGAKVIVAKSGDIIPQIIKVVSQPEDANIFSFPAGCPSCGKGLTLSGVHLNCTNDLCKQKIVSRLSKGLRVFGVKNIGTKTIEKFYDAGIYEIYEIFDKVLFNSQYLINTGYFTEGRSLEIILDAIHSIKEVTLEQIIESLAFPGIGKSISKQAALKLVKEEFDPSGLDRKLFESCTTKGSKEYDEIKHFVEILKSNNIKIITPKKKKQSKFTFEMTGTPPKLETIEGDILKKKADYVQFLEKFGFEHTSLNSETSYLITDSLESSSGKMSKALKIKGIEILTYNEIINRVLNNE